MRRIITGAALAAMTLTAAPAGADEAADKAVQHRQRIMGAVGASAGGLAAGLKGDAAYSEIIAQLGAMLAASADIAITSAAFAMNTTGQSAVKSTALPKVWDDPDDFQAGLRTLSERAQAIAAKGADVTGEDLKSLFETCKACHDDYRER